MEISYDNLEKETKRRDEAHRMVDNFYKFHRDVIDQYNRLNKDLSILNDSIARLNWSLREKIEDSPF